MSRLRIRSRRAHAIVIALLAAVVPALGVSPPAQDTAAPQVDEWGDEFDGAALDEAKWEPYTFDGNAGTIAVKDKLLTMRGSGMSRSGIRSKVQFHGDRFYVEAALSKVGARIAEPGESGFPPGYAILTVLFNGNPANRLEWLLRSDGVFEAWQATDGRMAKLDNGKLGTKEKSPRLGIARKGDQVFFMLNREVGLEKTIRGLSSDFKVMLYGFGSSENAWDSIYVQTLKQ